MTQSQAFLNKKLSQVSCLEDLIEYAQLKIECLEEQRHQLFRQKELYDKQFEVGNLTLNQCRKAHAETNQHLFALRGELGEARRDLERHQEQACEGSIF